MAQPRRLDQGPAMRIDAREGYRLERDGRYLKASLTRPHRVLSNCRINGGLREDLTHLANHQACEGVDHTPPLQQRLPPGPAAYHEAACAAAALPAASTALLATAANMQCAVVEHAAHADLEVTVVATAGVLGNATRAGDPAGWHEYPDGCQPLVRPSASATETAAAGAVVDHGSIGAGTVVLLVFISQPCTPAALVRAATLVTEAKSAALLDLRVPSLQSPRLATGTGTDQLAIAAPLARAGEWERHWAGSHISLGELLGQATHRAITRCLLLQNGLCAALRRNLCTALGRFGCDEAALLGAAQAHLDPADAQCFERNLLALLYDPLSAAAAYALAEVADLARTGVLPAAVAHEALLAQAAVLAAAVALAPEQTDALRTRLARAPVGDPGALAALAVVEGFARKWR